MVTTSHTIPLFDASVTPSSWNERMHANEFAVLFANLQPPDIDPSLGSVAVIFPSFQGAIAYANHETEKQPHLRCNIYDARGLGCPPLKVIAGLQGQDTNFLTPRFRLWAGGICVCLGTALGAVEMLSGMSLSWAGMIAARIGPAGVILLLTELGVRLSARQRRSAP